MREGAQDYLIKREVNGPLLGRALRESERRYALAVDGANDGVWDCRLRDNEVYFSARWKAMLGYREREIADRIEEWFDRVDQRDKAVFDGPLNHHLRGESAHFECEYRVICGGDETRWVSSRGLAFKDENGQALRIAGLMTDITRRKQTEARLLHETMHDALTSLPNKNLFIDRLDMALRRFRRDPTRLFGVLLFDLDRFNYVNDNLGHALGDCLLEQIAGRLNSCLRPGETLARFGGDEFGIVLNDIDGPADAIYVVERLQEALSREIEIETHTIYTTASIGIAICTDLYKASAEIVRDAGIAMYRAKNSGQATYPVFDTSTHDGSMLQH